MYITLEESYIIRVIPLKKQIFFKKGDISSIMASIYLLLILFLYLFIGFWDRVLLCNLGWVELSSSQIVKVVWNSDDNNRTKSSTPRR
jgi:hypothetical protein